MTKMISLDFYKEENYIIFINRLNKLSDNHMPKWGTMNSYQMLHHLNLAIGSGLGFYKLNDTSTILSRTIAKTFILRIKKGFIKNVFTPKNLRVVKNDLDFEVEKTKLKEVLFKARNTTDDSEWDAHTFFGKMTREEWGILISLHLDHHFRQFGI